MTQYNKDTLANLISCELHRMKELKQQAEKHGYTQGVEYWQKELDDLQVLDQAIWAEIA